MSVNLSAPETEEVSPQEAWKMLKEMPRTKLVDVRTVPEWLYVGLPEIDATKGELLRISWHVFPDMTMNVAFIQDLKRAASSDDVLLFVCRSGGRSLAAARAAKEAGFKQSYYIRGGFEGPIDAQGHRGNGEGWKCAGLPWRQQ
jgi:rhodanese-related sulfurtransferase